MSLRNNLIVERREALGLTPRQLADAAGIEYKQLLRYEGLKLSPRGARGWREGAQKLAAFLRVELVDLWPDVVLAVERSTTELRVSAEQIAAIDASPSSLDLLLDADADHALGATLHSLAPRTQRVLTLLYGLDGDAPLTREQVAALERISPTRVYQIECRGLAELRHPRSGLAARLLPR